MITSRSHAVPALQAPNPPTRVSRDRQPSIGALYGRPRECGGPMQIATPTHRAGRRGLPVQQGSIPRLDKGAGIVGQPAMVEHKAGHGPVGALGLRLGQCIAHVFNGAGRDANALGVILEGLGVHLQGLHFTGHDGDLLASRAADVAVLADQRAVAAQEVFSGQFAVVLHALLAAIRIGDDRSMGLRLGQFAGNQVHGGHWSAPRFDDQYIGPSVLVGQEVFS